MLHGEIGGGTSQHAGRCSGTCEMQAGVHLVVCLRDSDRPQRSDGQRRTGSTPTGQMQALNSTTAPPVMDAPTALAVEVAGPSDLSHHVAERLDVKRCRAARSQPSGRPQGGSPARFAGQDCLGQRDHLVGDANGIEGGVRARAGKLKTVGVSLNSRAGMMRGLPASCLLCAEGQRR